MVEFHAVGHGPVLALPDPAMRDCAPAASSKPTVPVVRQGAASPFPAWPQFGLPDRAIEVDEAPESRLVAIHRGRNHEVNPRTRRACWTSLKAAAEPPVSGCVRRSAAFSPPSPSSSWIALSRVISADGSAANPV